MRFASSAIALLGLAAAALGQLDSKFDPITSPTADEKVPAASDFTIKWTAAGSSHTGSVSLVLMTGDSADSLRDLSTIATGVDGSQGSYKWAVDGKLGDGGHANYYIRVVYEKNKGIFNISPPFRIVDTKSSGGGSTTTGSASGSSPSSTTGATALSTSSGKKTATATSPTMTTAAASGATAGSSSGSGTATGSGTAASSTPTGAAGQASAPLALIGAAAMAILAL